MALMYRWHDVVRCVAAGEVYAWGRGTEGQLGNGDIATGYFPKRGTSCPSDSAAAVVGV